MSLALPWWALWSKIAVSGVAEWVSAASAVGGWGDRGAERGGNFVAYMQLSKYYVVMSGS